MIPNNEFLSINFDNISLFEFNNIVHAWNLDCLQLRSGNFSADLSQIIYEDFQLGHVTFNTAVKQEGVSPQGMWTFAFVNDVKIYWRNYVIEPNAIIIYSPGSEVNAVSAENFEVATFSISDEYLMEIAKKEGIADFYYSLKHIDATRSNNPQWESLKNDILNEIAYYIQTSDCKNAQAFKESFTKKLLALLMDSQVIRSKVSGKKRLSLLHQFEQYVSQRITEANLVSHIVSYLNVSERTLLYACRNRFDMGPKNYMLVLKLNHANQALHKANNTSSVSSIVRDSGFWHMGQFYKDYKKFFGELPSKTLYTHSLSS